MASISLVGLSNTTNHERQEEAMERKRGLRSTMRLFTGRGVFGNSKKTMYKRARIFRES